MAIYLDLVGILLSHISVYFLHFMQHMGSMKAHFEKCQIAIVKSANLNPKNIFLKTVYLYLESIT